MTDEIDRIISEAEASEKAKFQGVLGADFKDILADFLGGDETGQFDDIAAELRRDADTIRRRSKNVRRVVVSEDPRSN